MENRNNVTEFVLLGLTQNPKLQKVIFAVFLAIYIVSTVGNVLTLVTSQSAHCWGPQCTSSWLISLILMLVTPLSITRN